MSETNMLGIVIIEALKALKDPVPLTAIISKVATLLDCPEEKIVDLVTKAIKGGVSYGYIQRRRERFAYFPINLTDFVDDENLNCNRKNKKGLNTLKDRSETFSTEVLFKSCKFRSTCNIKNQNHVEHNAHKRSVSSSARSRMNYKKIAQTTLTSSSSKDKKLLPAKGNKESQEIPKSKWRV